MGALLIATSSCKKEDNNNPVNLTNGKTTAVFNAGKTYGTITDQDGNIYKTITIGTQTWMAENLRTTKYRSGKVIPKVIDNSEWTSLTSGAYCNYKNTESNDTIATYGRLYNWYSVNDSLNIAPKGWHVPTNTEWNILITYLGGESVSGGKLKENGTTHWPSPNTGADKDNDFTALPGGIRDTNGLFLYANFNGFFWSSSEYDVLYSMSWVMYNNDSSISNYGYTKNSGLSVRCVKDQVLE